MRNTTLCYLERDGSLLMLFRNKKAVDENHGKWIGVGGKFEEGETPEECAVREVYEETGLKVGSLRLRGIITFVMQPLTTEYMFLYTCDDFSGELSDPDGCPEGILRWVEKEKLDELPMWEGDRIFLRLLMEEHPFFSLKLCYDQNGSLSQAVLDGTVLTV
ncbi:MAG TPA: 8-oxo-dGTP diphosphatase [Candidatus Faecivivens stercoripullorum]|uniref:8-oxo-dGTP diphosphatase n=1 Tax=Candidatus Faecivivens stercoripullorum TaxID=2840805 RepID=A0A9D1H5R3_9FIRM|nr:8-oxo-dGTP diphosphatase [Candidatus Faecivivens stercoripullorum]